MSVKTLADRAALLVITVCRVGPLLTNRTETRTTRMGRRGPDLVTTACRLHSFCAWARHTRIIVRVVERCFGVVALVQKMAPKPPLHSRLGSWEADGFRPTSCMWIARKERIKMSLSGRVIAVKSDQGSNHVSQMFLAALVDLCSGATHCLSRLVSRHVDKE